jgi:hypothetical protein
MKWLALLFVASTANAADLSALIADREAMERVYYNHRTGEKPPFEKTLTREQLRELVERDLRKEAVLKKRYHLEISEAQVSAEVARINSSTRAPEMLAELKTALGDNPDRFARTVARPLVVERLLRDRFQNDDALHVSQRREAEKLRAALLAAGPGTNNLAKRMELLRKNAAGTLSETTWQLDTRGPPESPPALSKARRDKVRYFNELSADLQNVLRQQLRGAGDVSAVIEAPDGFLIFLATQKTPGELATAAINIPKRDYDQWLAEQSASPTEK